MNFATHPMKRSMLLLRNSITLLWIIIALASNVLGDESSRSYRNQLTSVEDPLPLLADYPQYVQPIIESRRYQSPVLVDDKDADLSVRACAMRAELQNLADEIKQGLDLLRRHL